MSFVYLHGMGGSPADWRQVQSFLPGTSIALPASESFAEMIPLLAEKISEVPAPVLCGYSMGGRVALLLAEELLRRQIPPAGVALLSAGTGISGEKERELRNQIDEQWAKLAAENPEKFWQDWYRQPLFASFSALPAHLQNEWLIERKSINFNYLSQQLRDLGPAKHPDLLPIFPKLRAASISVLYLAGELDKKYLDLAQILAKQERATVEIIPGAGHILPLEAPQKIAERLRAFFPYA